MFYSYGMHPMRMGPYWLLRCFNPRTHTGCDHVFSDTIGRPKSFNPRTHTGCDIRTAVLSDKSIVSIHAPTRGATTHRSRSAACDAVSIHAPTRGATVGSRGHRKAVGVSIHAPTRGATEGCRDSYHGIFVSIHAPTRGATFIRR